MLFRDRREAGRRLAEALGDRREPAPALVLALPRGGVPIAFEVARALHAPLDVIGVRKLGAPDQPELGVGAIAEGGVVVVDEPTLRYLGLDEHDLADIERREWLELRRRVEVYRRGRALPALTGGTVVVVDDGAATGITMRAACRAIRALGAGRIVVALPVASREVTTALGAEADEVVCLRSPEPLIGVGRWYERFGAVRDDEVLDLLGQAARQRSGPARERTGEALT